MKTYLNFKNKGELPLNAFKLLGASTKREDETKIGFFGTGLKYALVVMLRNDIGFKVFVGDREVKIGLRKTAFADQTVQVMTVNGEKTSITLEAGIDWEPWFAIREIYSNALDEGGGIEFTDEIVKEPNTTNIYVEVNDKLGDVAKNWQHYFSNGREVISEAPGYKVLSKKDEENFTLFRKGIRAAHLRTASLFDYDVETIRINESRVAANAWEINQRAAEALALCDDEGAIRYFISQYGKGEYVEHVDQHWEYLFDNATYRKQKFSETWFEVLKGKRVLPMNKAGFYGVTSNSVIVPDRLLRHLHSCFGDRLNLVGLSKEDYIVTGDYNEAFDKSYELLNRFGFSHDKSGIKMVKFADSDIYGAYDRETRMILLSEALLSPTHSNIKTATLFEEIAHAQSGCGDNTRGFQDYLINTVVGLMEEGQ